MNVTVEGDHIVFRVSYHESQKAKSAGARWHAASRTWRAKSSRLTAAAVLANFSEGEYCPTIRDMAGSSVDIPEMLHGPDALIKDRVLRPRQLSAVMKAWPHPGFALFHVMGCVSADTEIQCLLASGKGRKLTIEQMYARNGKRTRARCLKGDQFGQHDVEEVVYSGVKFTYTLALSDGKSLRATKDHRILTPEGWKALGSLSVGEEVIVNGRVRGGTPVNKPDGDGYIRVRNKEHPRAWKSAKMVYQHILVMEDLLDRYLENGEVVHHKNGIKHDNRPENLELLSERDHLSVAHGRQYRANLDGGISTVSGGSIVVVPKKAQVVSIIPFGEEPTYDVCMKDPHHNFVANGIVVHNSGKTLSTIALANLRRSHELIDRLLIICPTSIKGVWKKEIGLYSAMPYDLQVLEAGAKLKPYEGYPALVVGVEALSQGGAADIAESFVAGGRTMVVVDESSTIKNHDAGRTEKCWGIGQSAAFRLILTGTNVTQGIQDLFAQMYFVDPAIIGELSYYSFRNKYCIMGGFEQRKIVGYRDIGALFDRIRPYCDVVRKGDMKLPPKQYQIREVKASPAQIKACKELARDMKTQLGDKMVTTQNALEALLRFQQIAGGFDPDGDPLPSNPKLAELLAILREFDGKAIIWARYLPEIAAITTALDKEWPGACLSMYGATAPSSRQAMVDAFQSDPKVRFFVTNQATGGKGLTLTAATLSVYYSNTFSLEDRLQSEDRNHRIGQENEVTYIDLKSDLKVDTLVLNALLNKKEVADYVGDSLRIDDLA